MATPLRHTGPHQDPSTEAKKNLLPTSDDTSAKFSSTATTRDPFTFFQYNILCGQHRPVLIQRLLQRLPTQCSVAFLEEVCEKDASILRQLVESNVSEWGLVSNNTFHKGFNIVLYHRSTWESVLSLNTSPVEDLEELSVCKYELKDEKDNSNAHAHLFESPCAILRCKATGQVAAFGAFHTPGSSESRKKRGAQNTKIALELIDHAASVAEALHEERIFFAFCGDGNFQQMTLSSHKKMMEVMTNTENAEVVQVQPGFAGSFAEHACICGVVTPKGITVASEVVSWAETDSLLNSDHEPVIVHVVPPATYTSIRASAKPDAVPSSPISPLGVDDGTIDDDRMSSASIPADTVDTRPFREALLVQVRKALKVSTRLELCKRIPGFESSKSTAPLINFERNRGNGCDVAQSLRQMLSKLDGATRNAIPNLATFLSDDDESTATTINGGEEDAELSEPSSPATAALKKQCAVAPTRRQLVEELLKAFGLTRVKLCNLLGSKSKTSSAALLKFERHPNEPATKPIETAVGNLLRSMDKAKREAEVPSAAAFLAIL